MQPAVKLMSFWKALLQSSTRDDSIAVEAGGIPTFQTKHAEALSNTLRTASAIGRPEAELWVKYWRDVGYIQA